MSNKRKLRSPDRSPRVAPPERGPDVGQGVALLRAAAARQPPRPQAAQPSAAPAAPPVQTPADHVPAHALAAEPALTAAAVARQDGGSVQAGAQVQAGALEVTRFSCGPVEGAEPQALGVTYRFQAPPAGTDTAVTVAFTGRRLDLEGEAGPRDSFTTQASVQPVLAGSGRHTLTARVTELNPGRWQVWAAPVPAAGAAAVAPVSAVGETAFAPVVRVRAPGVRLGAWPGLVSLGTVVALLTQAGLAAGRDLGVLWLFGLTFLACLLGVVGAKTYYLATHRGEGTGLLTVGMSVQGFVLTSITTIALGALITGRPVGTVLDVTTPGLLFGMTIGRWGCWLGGCCVGRPTASRWGLWSSDRRLGVRRIPVQLLESTVALTLGLLAVTAVRTETAPGGTVFIATIAAYTLARQLLFPLRDLPRATTHGRVITMAVSTTVLLADLAVAITS